MAKRWSAEDIRDLKTLAQEYSVQAIAEKMDRTVGGVAFKAHQLGLPLKARSQATAREFADLGGLMSYGVNQLDLARQAATYVDKILKGAKPAELPVEQPINFELVINLKAARELGVTISRELLLVADDAVE